MYGKTHAECKAKLDAVLEKIRAGAFVEPEKVTVKAWLEEWFDTFYRVTVKPSTAATTRGNLRRLNAALGDIRLQKLGAEQIQRFVNGCLAEGLQVSTVTRYLKVLEQAMNQARDLGRISRDPMKGVKLPAMNKPDIPFLTREEQEAFLPVIPSTTGGRALRFLLGTGLRFRQQPGQSRRQAQSESCIPPPAGQGRAAAPRRACPAAHLRHQLGADKPGYRGPGANPGPYRSGFHLQDLLPCRGQVGGAGHGGRGRVYQGCEVMNSIKRVPGSQKKSGLFPEQ